jgi:predicted nucleic acid-binding protein
VTLVVDASAYLFVALSDAPGARAVEERMADTTCHAPHLLEAEVGSALRRHVRAGRIDPDLAREGLLRAGAVVEQRHPHDFLVLMAWGLRAHVSFYDALYVALAATLDAPLLTADRRLGRAHGLPCAVDLVA